MSRRNDENGKIIVYAIIIVIVISVISSILEAFISFISEYYIYIIIFIFLILFIIALYRIYLSKKNKQKLRLEEKKINNNIQKYESSPYFKETQTSYETIAKDMGLRFEMKVFNTLSKHFPNAYLITNLLIPRIGSVNEYSEIDILFLHTTGLYVLELKNYTGYIYGNLSSSTWRVGYENDKPYEFQNPIRQNEKHIIDLKKHRNESYIGYVIFNETTELDSYIDNLSYYKQFREMVESKPSIYSIEELESIRDFIKSINVYDKINNHIKRIKYNKSRKKY